MDRESRKEIKRVEKILGDIRSNTRMSFARYFTNGLLYGSGIVLGTLLSITLLGWLLSVFGIIPGLDVIAAYIDEIFKRNF